jgi:mannose-1-phosphate guanylyltransferase
MPPSRVRDERRWGIVLAAGQVTRLGSVTTTLHGQPMPRQFAAVLGERSLLQATVQRLGELVPARRTVAVVDAGQARLAEDQLSRHVDVRLVRQPRDRGTAASLLLPLAEVLAREAGARVLVLPADHLVTDEERFQQACEHAFRAAERAPSGVALIGAPATLPAADLGWIVPGEPLARDVADGYLVERFVERPDPAQAEALRERGALWNTLMLAGRGEALWALVARRLPAVGARLSCYRFAIDRPEAAGLLDDAYAHLPSTDLGADVLEQARGLAVVPLGEAGWTDCATPQQILRALGAQKLRQRSTPPGGLRDYFLAAVRSRRQGLR